MQVLSIIIVGFAMTLTSCSPSSPPSGVACVTPGLQWFPFCNTSLPIPARVADLISRIHDSDKAALLTARGWPQGNVTSLPYLGVPAFDWGLNCVHGVQSNCVNNTCPTSFPNPCGLGATWNMTVVRHMARTIGVEARALWLAGAREPSLWSGMAHIGLDCWSPNININRDPRWGRNQEVPSEDPHLAAAYAVAYTKGIQYNPDIDPNDVQTVVTLKHWAAYSLDDSDGWVRYDFDARVSQYDLHDTYLRAFHAAVTEANAKGVMCSYNSLNGVPACGDPWLRNKLRNEWHFSGYVTSDTDSVACMYAPPPLGHLYSTSPEEACCQALVDGQTDINSGGTYYTYLARAVNQSLCGMSDVDLALTHTLTVRFELGLFDGADAATKPHPFWSLPLSLVNDEAAKHASLDAAVQSLVLLQNVNKTLPLLSQMEDRSSRHLSVAFLGPSANQSAVLLGSYLGWLCPGGPNDFSCVETPLAAFLRIATGVAPTVNVSVQYAQGCHHAAMDGDGELLAAAMAVAEVSDVMVFLGGLDESLEAEMHDRTSIALPLAQELLLRNLSAAFPTKPLVVVLFNGGAVAIDSDLLQRVGGLLEAWYPGPHGGDAVAKALLGLVNPGGKLPVTVYPASYVTLVNMSDMNMTTGVGRSYRYLSPNITPVFPFGFGLSYTEFRWSCALVGNLTKGESLTVMCAGVNAGAVDGDDVVQLYVVPSANVAPVRPHRSLVDFLRVHVPVGGDEVVATFSLTGAQFCFTASNGTRYAPEGVYQLLVANGGADNWTQVFDVHVPSSVVCPQI